MERRPPAAARPVEPWDDEPRIDATDKLTGRARYVDDLPVPRDTAYAAAIRSPYSHARIVSIDATRALRTPGVLDVLDRDHLDGLDARVPLSEFVDRHDSGEKWAPGEQVLLATEKVRFDGDLVGMVVAEDLATARTAARLVEVEYDVLPAVFSFAEAIAPGAPLLHEELGTNLACEDSLEWGDVERGMRDADQVLDERAYAGNVFHHPMEPSISCIASFSGDHADLVTSTHKPYIVAPQLAHLLFGIPPENVRVRIPVVGGGFGAKEIGPAVMAAMALSRRIGRPVKYVPTARESFRSVSRHAIEYRARIGVRADGTLVALDVELEIDTGAYFTGAAVVAHNASISAWGCYRIPHFRVRARSVYTNKVPASAFRGTGKNQTTFGIESALDSVARKLEMEPFELRERNVLRRGEYVAETWRVRGVEYPADTPPMDTDFPDLMRRAAEGIGWDGRSRKGAVGGPIVRGRGLALSFRHGYQGTGRTYAMVSLDRAGTLHVYHNAPDMGTGVYNTIAVVASRSLGFPRERIQVHTPDTGNRLPFMGTSAQRTTIQMGNAVDAACAQLRRELADAAALAFGGTPPEWSVADGKVSRGAETLAYADVVRAFQGRSTVLSALGSYSCPPSRDRAFGGLDGWSPGVAAAEVEVDMETGEVRIVRYCGVADAGKVIHRTSARGQVEGGAVMGMGSALFEDLVYRDGQLLNADPLQYRLPLMSDVPSEFEVALVENGDGPGPFGAKAIAQTSLPCAAPAIAAAIADATGVALTSLPITPESLLRALGALGSSPDTTSSRVATAAD